MTRDANDYQAAVELQPIDGNVLAQEADDPVMIVNGTGLKFSCLSLHLPYVVQPSPIMRVCNYVDLLCRLVKMVILTMAQVVLSEFCWMGFRTSLIGTNQSL